MTNVASALNNMVDTLIVMPKSNSTAFQELCEKYEVRYKALPLTRITKELLPALKYPVFFLIEIYLLVKLCRRENIEIIHVSGGSWQYKGVIAGKLAGKKVIWHLNDTAMPKLFCKIFSMFSPLADGFIYASDRSQNYYKPLVNSKKQDFVIPAPVDTKKFNPAQEHSGDEQLIQGWQGKFVIGTVANINPVKGLETLIHAAAFVNKKNINVQFVVVGPVFSRQKRYYESLQKLCVKLGVNNIEFVGSRSDVRSLLKRFDIYVCSSNAESSPISVWESMSMAKPIVSTDVGDVPLYVKDGVNGFIINVGESEALADRIGRLIADEPLREQFGSQSRKVVIQELDLSRCAERHIEAYKAIFDK